MKCTFCESTSFEELHGHYVCTVCGIQSSEAIVTVTEELQEHEFEEGAGGAKQQIRAVVFGERKTRSWATYEEGIQTILRAQCEILVTDFGFPPQLISLVGKLWFHFLATPDAPHRREGGSKVRDTAATISRAAELSKLRRQYLKENRLVVVKDTPAPKATATTSTVKIAANSRIKTALTRKPQKRTAAVPKKVAPPPKKEDPSSDSSSSSSSTNTSSSSSSSDSPKSKPSKVSKTSTSKRSSSSSTSTSSSSSSSSESSSSSDSDSSSTSSSSSSSSNSDDLRRFSESGDVVMPSRRFSSSSSSSSTSSSNSSTTSSSSSSSSTESSEDEKEQNTEFGPRPWKRIKESELPDFELPKKRGTRLTSLIREKNTMHLTLELIYLATLYLRVPILPNDLVQWCSDGKLPYWNGHKALPATMVAMRLLKPSSVPSPEDLLSKTLILAKSLKLAKPIPPVNAVPLLTRICTQLDVPPSIEKAAQRLLRMNNQWDGSLYPPEKVSSVQFSAYERLVCHVLIAIKLLFRFDDSYALSHIALKFDDIDTKSLPEWLVQQFQKDREKMVRNPWTVPDVAYLPTEGLDGWIDLLKFSSEEFQTVKRNDIMEIRAMFDKGPGGPPGAFGAATTSGGGATATNGASSLSSSTSSDDESSSSDPSSSAAHGRRQRVKRYQAPEVPMAYTTINAFRGDASTQPLPADFYEHRPEVERHLLERRKQHLNRVTYPHLELSYEGSRFVSSSFLLHWAALRMECSSTHHLARCLAKVETEVLRTANKESKRSVTSFIYS